MNPEETIVSLFEQWSGTRCMEYQSLHANGSNRLYWRMHGLTGQQCIAAYNEDVRENEAFFYYCRALRDRGIHVPELYSVSDDHKYYLQQDLGDVTLFSHLSDHRKAGGGFDAGMLTLYKQVLADLAQMQVAGRDMDFTHAYPRSDFDRQSIQWDLNYFKYYFLKLTHTPFDEELLERDFSRLTDYLLEADCGFFLYRDFQARNIMLYENTPYYIDFQGGRRGAAQYDVASLLYSARSEIPEVIRQELLEYYIQCLANRYPIDTKVFRQQFHAYVRIRIMQTLGAYGFRGLLEKKEQFISSIPLALHNLRIVTENQPLPIALPHLEQVWRTLAERSISPEPPATEGLTVEVGSFSYKKGLPQDTSGNGGGFIFDCRALPNPGRYPEYLNYTGKDRPVIEFLQDAPAVKYFLNAAKQMVGPSVKRYLERNFTHLSVYFGCTGGQHRSVYCAERLAEWLSENFDCHVVLIHREQQ